VPSMPLAALWETVEDGVVRYACHVGHQYARDSLLSEHGQAVEQALWTAVRILEQHAELRQRMSARARAQGLAMVAEGFAEDSRDHHTQAQSIRRLVFGQRDRVEPESVEPRKARAR
jgi:two-component system chemotaxis response regulator CheB